MNLSMGKSRNCSIELLRVMAMLFIVLVHLLGKTSVIEYIDKDDSLYYVCWFLYGACGMGINVLVMISGYYWDKSKFKVSKIIKLWLSVFFYSVTLTILAKYFLKIEIIDGLKASIFPLTNRVYWFFSTYIGLYFLTPYIKKFVQSLVGMQFRTLISILTVLLSVIPTLFGCNDWLGDGGTSGIVWFIYLYLLGIYCKKSRCNKGVKFWFILLGSMLMVGPIIKITFEYIGWEDVFKKNINILFGSNSIFCIIASVALFHLFSNIRIENKKLGEVINYLGQGCFGVYLIHNNRNISHFLWEKLQVYEWVVRKKSLLMIFVLVTGVFLVCNIVDHIKEIIFKWLQVERLTVKVEEWMRKCYFCK